MEELGRAPLRALVELSRRGTMAAVAEELGYTAGAVSQQLARLEAAVGQPLLSKVGRGVRLTDAGRVLADHAVEVLRAEEAALAAVHAVSTEVVGRITIGVFGSTAGALLAPLVLRLAEEHPGVTVLSREVDVDDSATAVRRGEVDVAFGVDYANAPMPRDAGTELVPLRSEVFCLAVAQAYSGADRIPLRAAAGWPWILTPGSAPFGRAIRNACRTAGFEPEVIHEITDTAAAILLATRGLGITPVTPLMRQLVAGEPRVVALHEPITRQVVLIRHRADRGRPTVAVVTQAAQAVAADRPGRRKGVATIEGLRPQSGPE
jgi:DNA-binding transcriptional LysR family regulator